MMRQNFMIVGTQRTGSTILARSLNFHAHIASSGEWVQYVPWHQKLQMTQRALTGDFSQLLPLHQELMEKVFNEHTRWLGFKLLFRSSAMWLHHPRLAPALWVDRLEAYLRWLSHQPHIHIIHIVRRDAIEWLKSKYVASQTGIFTGQAYPEHVKVRIPLHGAAKRLQAKNWIDHRLATLSATHPYCRVYYEDFLQNDQAATAAMMQFLQCDPTQLREINFRVPQRQSKGQGADYISNYDELLKALQHQELLRVRL